MWKENKCKLIDVLLWDVCLYSCGSEDVDYYMHTDLPSLPYYASKCRGLLENFSSSY
jgi:hypothetical protein